MTAFMGNSGVVAAGGGGEEILFAATTYTGNGSSLDVDTGQNLASGGLVWAKRTNGAQAHFISDTARGTGEYLSSNSTALAATGETGTPAAYLSNGVRYAGSSANINTYDYILFSWLEREGYFDAVTYNGSGGGTQNISHNLGAVPAMMIVKVRGNSTNWAVYHRDVAGDPETDYLLLNTNAARADDSGYWNDTSPTSSQFSVGLSGDTNSGTSAHIAYLFAEKAGFSKAGSYTGTGSSGNAITGLGFQPNSVLIKRTDSLASWYLYYDDGTGIQRINPNGTGGASSGTTQISFDSDGFTLLQGNPDINGSGGTYIYMAWK